MKIPKRLIQDYRIKTIDKEYREEYLINLQKKNNWTATPIFWLILIGTVAAVVSTVWVIFKNN